MFKNRAFQVKVVNADTSDNSNAPVQEPIDPQKIIVTMTGSIATLIGVYMATDTIRQIAIHTAHTTIK